MENYVTPNRYEPPKAVLSDNVGHATAPPLWNPNAAANWSLLFSPAFGAFLHMKNWQALAQPHKAMTARFWFVLTLVLFGGLAITALSMPSLMRTAGFFRPGGFLLLICWYFGSARGQAAYVKANFGNIYPRRGWFKPLTIAIVAVFAFIGVFTIVATELGRAM